MDPSSSSHPAYAETRFIDEGRVELVRVIGSGAYGLVYLAIDSASVQPQYRAVKCLRRTGLDSRQKHFQRREIALHRLASAHPSIICMDRLIEEGEHVYVVMDYGDEGDLFAMVTEKQRYVGDDELIRDVFLQLLDGVQYLHSLGIAHRDVKPENVVCSEDGTRVRICDFGLATSEIYSSEFGCGSTFYIAPEGLGDWYPTDSQYPTQQGDVWSLGVILVNLVCGRNPWRIASPTDESFNAFLKDPYFLRRILPISEECLYILTQIFTLNPWERIDLDELRLLVERVPCFSMSEQELRSVHAAAALADSSASDTAVPGTCDITLHAVMEETRESQWEDAGVFHLDEDGDTPSLSADSGSPSPPAHRSRSASFNGGSSPPTPLLSAETALRSDLIPPPSTAQQSLWEYFKQSSQTSSAVPEVRINPTTPDALTSTQANPFFR